MTDEKHPCFGCDVTEKCLHSKPDLARQCPCSICIVKMTCRKTCNDWDIFFRESISPQIKEYYR